MHVRLVRRLVGTIYSPHEMPEVEVKVVQSCPVVSEDSPNMHSEVAGRNEGHEHLGCYCSSNLIASLIRRV
jgi:hypothetical protein